MKLVAVFFSSVLAAMCALTGSASASFLYVQTTPAGAAALFPGQPVITFDSATPGVYSTYTSNGVTFTSDSGAMYIDSDFAGGYNTFGNSLHNCYCDNSFGTLNMAFDEPVSGVGFFWGASDDQWTLSVYNASDTLIKSDLLPITYGSNAGDFVGIMDPGIALAVLSGPSGDYVFVDNVTGVSAIPETSTWAMLMVGFAGLGFAGYRRTKSAAFSAA